MKKEVNAVQSEFDLNFDSDTQRICLVNQETCDQSHDFVKFSIGNRKTLKEDPEKQGIDVRKRLLEFYSEHYSANIMTLCVIGKHSLNELQTMIVKRLPFIEIENKKVRVKLCSEILASSRFKEEHLQKEIKIVPKRNKNQLCIGFIPLELYRSSLKKRWCMTTAWNYIQNLFNQKHKGSILAELKYRKGLNRLFSPFRKAVLQVYRHFSL